VVGELPPIADAGEDATFGVNDTMYLNGSLSRSQNNRSISCSWQQLFGPASTIYMVSTCDMAHLLPPLAAGDYLFRITVTEPGNSDPNHARTSTVLHHVALGDSDFFPPPPNGTGQPLTPPTPLPTANPNITASPLPTATPVAPEFPPDYGPPRVPDIVSLPGPLFPPLYDVDYSQGDLLVLTFVGGIIAVILLMLCCMCFNDCLRGDNYLYNFNAYYAGE
jgi:hypothetical protein